MGLDDLEVRDTPPALHDFTEITRDKGRVQTVVILHTPYQVKLPKDPKFQCDKWDKWDYRMQFEWLRFCQCEILKRGEKGVYSVGARLLNATDFEHDSAWALKFELVGVEFKMVTYGQTILEGWIRSDSFQDFRVPPPNYNPITLPGTKMCKDKDCRRGRETHPILPEGFYVPPVNKKLFEEVRGCRVEIRTGVVYPEEP